MSMMHESDRLLTVRQAAERLGNRCPKTLERWVKYGLHGFPKFRKIGARNYVSETELAAFIRATGNGTPAE